MHHREVRRLRWVNGVPIVPDDDNVVTTHFVVGFEEERSLRDALVIFSYVDADTVCPIPVDGLGDELDDDEDEDVTFWDFWYLGVAYLGQLGRKLLSHIRKRSD